jgi:glucans biosynthesis protein
MDVESQLFPRKSVSKLGIAPLTSMFFYGEGDRPVNDFRPEVHDSDGLLIAMDTGEWLWRPLANIGRLSVNAFTANSPRGFGLLQRDTIYDHYLDLEARYDLRPSIWVEPKGNWGEGRVELIQIPTPSEVNDNIVAFWVPRAPVEPGRSLAFAYQMSWFLGEGKGRSPRGHVTSTHIAVEDERIRKFVLEFDGDPLRQLPADTPVEAVIGMVGAKTSLVENQVYKNPVTGGWRVVFELAGEEEKPLNWMLNDNRNMSLELRVFLRHGADVLTETWNYELQL